LAENATLEQRLLQSMEVIRIKAIDQFNKQPRRVFKYPMAVGGSTIPIALPMEAMGDCTTSVAPFLTFSRLEGVDPYRHLS